MNLANSLSFLRIVLTFLFSWLLTQCQDPAGGVLFLAAKIVFVIACVTDILDGWAARSMRQETLLGKYLDPIADKTLILVGLLSLGMIRNVPDELRLPLWVVYPIIARDVLIVLGAWILMRRVKSFVPEPIMSGKWCTFMQMSCLGLFFVSAPPMVRNAIFLVTVLITLLSGLQYLKIGLRTLRCS